MAESKITAPHNLHLVESLLKTSSLCKISELGSSYESNREGIVTQISLSLRVALSKGLSVVIKCCVHTVQYLWLMQLNILFNFNGFKFNFSSFLCVGYCIGRYSLRAIEKIMTEECSRAMPIIYY